MAQHCPKHDVTFSEGGVCWCCEQEKKNPKTQDSATKSAPVPVATGGK